MRRNPGELVAGRDLVQVFKAVGGELAFISPVLATYARQNAGSITLSLHRVSPSLLAMSAKPPATATNRWKRGVNALLARLNLSPRPAICGEQITSLTLSCRSLIDGEAVDMSIGRIEIEPGELLALRIRTTVPRRAPAPTIWLNDNDARIPGHLACYIGSEDQKEFGIEATLIHGGLEAETSVPRAILYSPVTQCNLSCIHCISAHTRGKVSKLPMAIKAQIQQWSAGGQLGILASDYSGDILWADARFGGELDYIFGLSIPFHIDTNGVHLTAEVAERLCRSQIVSLNISLDAARPETFKRVRRGSPPLGEVLENISSLMRIRAATRAEFPVSISLTLMRSTLAEWSEFVRLAAELGVDKVVSRHLEAFTPEMEKESLWHDQAAFNAARLEIEALRESLGILVAMPPPFSGKSRGGRKPCHVPWSSAVVLGNGDVAACCIPGTVMGNLNEASMEEIWNGLRYRRLRNTVNSQSPDPVCATCPAFRHTDNRDSYLIYSGLQRLQSAPDREAG
jgi:radical SAM protein with 4Fe4S-binding SPASM domain